MDFSKSEQIELEALIQRHNHLVNVTKENNCGYDESKFPDFEKKTKEKNNKKPMKSNTINLNR